MVFFLPIGPICHWFKINNFTYMWVGYSKILSHEPQNLLFLTVQFFSSNFVLKPPMHALMSGKQPQHYGCIDNSPTGVKYIIVCICFCFLFCVWQPIISGWCIIVTYFRDFFFLHDSIYSIYFGKPVNILYILSYFSKSFKKIEYVEARDRQGQYWEKNSTKLMVI